MISRVERIHNILKYGLEIFRGDIKNIIDIFRLFLRERYHEIRIILNNEKEKFVQKFNAEFYSRMIRKISIYALNIMRLQDMKFKLPF
jgi:hypothetical protein